jgi:hypothetical protein
MRLRFARWFATLLVLALALVRPLSATAGTTGNLSGVVVDTSSGAPLAKATVTAVSPSQTESATTDSQGRFTLLSLAPDTYTITAQEPGYDAASVQGITVLADQTQRLALQERKTLQEIGHVTTRANGDLVKPGTTSDVYSVNATVAGLAQSLGGGGALNQAYSGIAAVPGAVVPVGQSGWDQAVYIRGSYLDQTGFELDGVPAAVRTCYLTHSAWCRR